VVAVDGTVTVTYRIREEAVWEDGTPVTAADLAFTHGLIIGLGDRLGSDALMRAHKLVDPATVDIDGKTIAFELTRPDPAYEMLFEWVLPAHVINPATFTDDWNDHLWPSAGPFRFVSTELAEPGSSDPSIVVVERNPSYWETNPGTPAALPYLDGIEVHAFAGGTTNPSDITTLMTTGTLDAVLAGLLWPSEQATIGDLEDLGVSLVVEWDTLFEVLGVNLGEGRFEVNADSHNEELSYRRAVLSAIDRAALGEAVSAKPVNSILGLAVDEYDHHAWAAYDDASATDGLLAGVESTPRAVYITSSADETIRIANGVIDLLNEAGIEATGDYVGDFFGTQLPRGLLDLYAFRIFAGPGGLSGVAHMLSAFDPDEGLALWSELTDEAVQYREVVAAAQSEIDQDQLATLIEEAEAILADIAVIYPLVRRQPSHRAFWPGRIQGIIPNRSQGWDTWNAATWLSPTG
ncbi:MAG: ABC transporter substrate-binding protein, partial [Acidimicrobiia bacterium]|nr:ABC transporter substrate-binding protein [Acidimicrobiia bacterium]